jgi:predicted ester cyclase
MSTQENKAIYRRLIEEVLNRGNLTVAEEEVAATYLRHDAGPSQPRGPEGFKQRAVTVRAAFPDVQYNLDEVIAEGDKVACRWTARATHTGTFFGLGQGADSTGAVAGIPPTGRRVTWRGVDFCRIVDGKLAESWSTPDRLGLLQQLGATPRV